VKGDVTGETTIIEPLAEINDEKQSVAGHLVNVSRDLD